jgi:hypothetical protein
LDGDMVAALRPWDRGRGLNRGQGKGASGHGRSGRGGGRPASAADEQEASREARLAAGLCVKHWSYGEAASSCMQPCSWQGNGGAGDN